MKIDHLINGKPVAGRDYFETVNPATQGVLAEVASGGEAEVHAAVAAAKAAFPKWAGLPATERAKQLSRALRKAEEVFKPEIQSKMVRVREDERGLVITLSGDSYFDTGSARLRDDIKPVLRKVGGIVKSISNFVRIEGHTDDRAIPPAGVRQGFETNWELSSARSVNVLRYLTEEEKLNPRQLSAVAFGQYRPIDDNNTPEGRAYNRRVEIVILKEKGLEESGHRDIQRPLPDEEWR